jgi:hypothetical protein
MTLKDNHPLPAIEDTDLLEEVYSHKSLAPIPVASLHGDEPEKQRMLDNERYITSGLCHVASDRYCQACLSWRSSIAHVHY